MHSILGMLLILIAIEGRVRVCVWMVRARVCVCQK